MSVAEPKSTVSKPKRRWLRVIKRTLLVSLGLAVVLLVAKGLYDSFWFQEYLRSRTMDYDREHYTQIRRGITSDPEHLLGKPFEEVSRELSLDNVPWDDVALQERGAAEVRMYHFRGFYLHVYLDILPVEIMPNSDETWTSTELKSHKALRLDGRRTFVRIDGIGDPKEQMEQWKKAVEESERRDEEERTREKYSG